MAYNPIDPLVPSQDSADNIQIRDVVGNKTDTEAGDSLYSKVLITEEHLHSTQLIYPTLASPVTITGGAGAWELGAFATIVPASTITELFDIHWVQLSGASDDDEYELWLYYGATDILAGKVPFTADSTALISVVSPSPMQTPIIPANSQIRAKLASAGGGNDTVDVKILYHTY